MKVLGRGGGFFSFISQYGHSFVPLEGIAAIRACLCAIGRGWDLMDPVSFCVVAFLTMRCATQTALLGRASTDRWRRGF